MKKSTLKPFLRENLDILFVGLNPAKGSDDNGHYFSVNQAFWNQLAQSGLIVSSVNKSIADELVFGDNSINVNNLEYGITDLLNVAESDSSKVEPTYKDCENLEKDILKYKPKVVVLLHSKVIKCFVKEYLTGKKYTANYGKMGQLLERKGCNTMFYYVAFPHGNNISGEKKVAKYKEIKKYILNE